MARTKPNIIVTGTPGCGKTTHCEQLATALGMKHLSVTQFVKDKGCHDGFDEEWQSWIVDEDKLLDEMEPEALEGGCIIDWHSCEIFPQSWIDLVVVLRVNSTLLYDRLKARNYAENKLQENLDSEIMEVCLEEARESYDPQIVVELTSDTTEDMESNVERIQGWYEQWLKDNKSNA